MPVVIATLLGEKRIVTLLCTFRQTHLQFHKKTDFIEQKISNSSEFLTRPLPKMDS